MTLDQLSDDDIIAEVRKLQYLYGLKHEIRYGQTRQVDAGTESVAEHVFGMHILALYFLQFEDPDRKWDWLKVFTMITIHDFDEIETGDTIGYLKTSAEYAAEESARAVVTERSPTLLQPTISAASREYEERVSREALFARAIDKFEPLIHLYNENGRRIHMDKKCTLQHSESIKIDHVKHFASIKRFTDTLHNRMVVEGYFYVES